MAVAGDCKSRRGIILAKNEPAKKYGVVTAETVWEAKKKCPQLLLVPPRHGEYSKYCRVMNRLYQRYTDLVEPFGIDESWLDVTGSRKLFGSGPEIAEKIRLAAKNDVGLTVSVGVSFNKCFAKLGSDYKKPDAVTCITRENYRDIVWELPVGRLLFVGRTTEQALEKMGIRYIGQLALCDPDALTAAVGSAARQLWEHANGNDPSPVLPSGAVRVPKSVGNGTTLPRDLSVPGEIAACAADLCELVAARLRAAGMRCLTLQVSVKDPQFRVRSRQCGLPAPTDISADLKAASAVLTAQLCGGPGAVRAVTVTASGLVPGRSPEQMSLCGVAGAPDAGLSALEAAKDKIRKKYGERSLRYAGSMLGGEDGAGSLTNDTNGGTED